MKSSGKIKDISKDFETNRILLTVELQEQIGREELSQIRAQDLLDITIEKHKKKKSNNANSYAWVLMQQLAEACNTDKMSIYIEMLKRYSRSFTHIICKEEAVENMKEIYRACIDLGVITVNGQTGHQLQVYYGSSTFDSKEMSVFIDGIVSECKELGISTISPNELERMKSLWNKK